MDKLAELNSTPFDPEAPGRVFPCSNIHSGEDVALYCNRTYNEPAILIDIKAHIGNGDNGQIIRSINHEVFHAIQEWEGLLFDEDDAELWIPVFKDRD